MWKGEEMESEVDTTIELSDVFEIQENGSQAPMLKPMGRRLDLLWLPIFSLATTPVQAYPIKTLSKLNNRLFLFVCQNTFSTVAKGQYQVDRV